jgi:hypothetical protein
MKRSLEGAASFFRAPGSRQGSADCALFRMKKRLEPDMVGRECDRKAFRSGLCRVPVPDLERQPGSHSNATGVRPGGVTINNTGIRLSRTARLCGKVCAKVGWQPG